MMRGLRDWQTKPLFGLVAIALSALFAYSTLQQITFVPGVPSGSHIYAFAILFVGFLLLVLAAWSLFVLLWNRLRSK